MRSFTISLLGVLSIIIFIGGCNNDTDPVPQTDYGNSRITIQDDFRGEDFVVYANGTIGFMQAYSRYTEDGTLLEFEVVKGKFPIILQDLEGNEWNAFGIAESGPRAGQQLKVMNTMIGFWFSLAAMYPEVTLYGEPEKDKIPSGSFGPDWLVNPKEVFFGASKDAIRALDLPGFSLFRSVTKDDSYIQDQELVIVQFDGEQIRIYPHKILDWHEIINDESALGETVISYCPLTGTASVWNREIDNTVHTFGVSGILYNSNLILFDRQTDSNWSQMKQLVVNGTYISRTPEILPYFEMTWSGAKKLSNQLYVLSEDTGSGRNYDDYPYGDYRTTDRINFPLSYEDERVPPKERVLGVIVDGAVKVYRFSDFD